MIHSEPNIAAPKTAVMRRAAFIFCSLKNLNNEEI